MNETPPEQIVQFVRDCHSLQTKYHMDDESYLAALAGWLIAFCYKLNVAPVEVIRIAETAASEEVTVLLKAAELES